MRFAGRVAILAVVLILVSVSVWAQSNLEMRVQELERRHSSMNSGAVVFLFGAFCALWAQNTGRSAWLWFFAGAAFNFLAVLVLLSKNSDDRRKRFATAVPA